MRKYLIAIALAFAMFGVFAETSDANWEFDPDAKTISDGVWTFNATLSGSNITIGLITSDGYPSEISPLDFSKKVVKKGEESTEYQITVINSMFYHYAGDKVWETGAELIGKFTLPGEGLITMGGDGPSPKNSNDSNLFGDIVVPSTVTYIGRYWFQGSKITSITFGAGTGSIGATACVSCSALTSVVFKAGGSYTLENNARPFASCTALKNADLSGVVWIGGDSNHSAFGNCSSLTNITLNSNLFLTNSSSTYGTIGHALFNGNTKLATIRFTGPAPDELDKWIAGDSGYLGVLPSSQSIATIVPAEYRNVKNSSGKCWSDYSASGRLNTTDSTFASAHVKTGTDLSKRMLLLDRVPDDDPPTVTDPTLSKLGAYHVTVTANGSGLNGGAVFVSLTNNVGAVSGPTELDAFDKSCTFEGLAANAQYAVIVVATNNYGAATNAAVSFTTLDPPLHTSVTKTSDVDQATQTAGEFVISRNADDSVAKDLVVNYTVDGTAVAGTDYVALSGTVTIPAGERSVTIAVQPLYNLELSAARTLTLTIDEAEAYEIVTSSATMTISQSVTFDGWTYDGTSSISKNGWTFTVSVSGTDMTVGTCTAWPDEVSPLDFSKIVVSSSGAYYKIVKLNTGFGYYNDKQAFRVGGRDPQAYRVGALTIPEGVSEISSYSFGSCTNLTLAAPFPASLKVIGDYTFSSTKMVGDLSLTNLTSIGVAAVAGTPITSLTFGPNLASVGTSYDRGFVQNCTSLTNIYFDSDATAGMIGQFTFKGCTKLTELDLSPFTSFQDPTKTANSAFLKCSSLKKLIFSDKMQCIYPYSLYTTDSGLEEVVFTGLPPIGVFTNYLSGASSTKMVKTYVHKSKLTVSNSVNKCWLDYAANGVINHESSTWKGDYLPSGVTDLTVRPLLTIESDAKAGLMLFVR